MVSLDRHTSGTDLSENFRRAVYASKRICGRWKLIKPCFQIPDFDSLYLALIGSLRTIIPLFGNTYTSNTSTVNFNTPLLMRSPPQNNFDPVHTMLFTKTLHTVRLCLSIISIKIAYFLRINWYALLWDYCNRTWRTTYHVYIFLW